MRECKFGLVRSLLSKCVSQNELGKMFTIFAISIGLVPLISNFVFRQLYNATLTHFPGAEIVLAACCLCLTAILNFYLYTQRDRMLMEEKDETQETDKCHG